MSIRGSDWTIVGSFSTGGDAHESEVWVDVGTAQSAFRRNGYSSMLVQLETPEAYAAFMAMEAARWAPVVRAAGRGVD